VVQIFASQCPSGQFEKWLNFNFYIFWKKEKKRACTSFNSYRLVTLSVLFLHFSLSVCPFYLHFFVCLIELLYILCFLFSSIIVCLSISLFYIFFSLSCSICFAISVICFLSFSVNGFIPNRKRVIVIGIFWNFHWNYSK